MKTINLENADLIADLFEEAWTVEGAIAIYPYEDNKIVLLTKEDLKDNDLVNSIYANEDVALISTECFEQVEGFQNILRDMFKAEIMETKMDILADEISIELAEKLNRYTDIYDILGGDECLV